MEANLSYIDDGMAESYAEEFKDHLESIENNVLALENDPDVIDSIFRVIHSVKGSAGMLGYAKVSELAHAIENILSQLKSGICQPTGDLVDLLLESQDQLKKLFEDLQNSNNADLSALLLKIDTFTVQHVEKKTRKKIDPPSVPITAKDVQIDPTVKKRILIVEDDVVNQLFLEKAIEQSEGNFSIKTVDSAAKGIYQFFTEQFDMIFLDIMMPKIDGNTFVDIVEENLQAGYLKKRPNIVVQTAIQSIESLSMLAQNECVQEILRKPIKRDRVIETVYRYCYEPLSGK